MGGEAAAAGEADMRMRRYAEEGVSSSLGGGAGKGTGAQATIRQGGGFVVAGGSDRRVADRAVRRFAKAGVSSSLWGATVESPIAQATIRQGGGFVVAGGSDRRAADRAVARPFLIHIS